MHGSNQWLGVRSSLLPLVLCSHIDAELKQLIICIYAQSPKKFLMLNFFKFEFYGNCFLTSAAFTSKVEMHAFVCILTACMYTKSYRELKILILKIEWWRIILETLHDTATVQFSLKEFREWLRILTDF